MSKLKLTRIVLALAAAALAGCSALRARARGGDGLHERLLEPGRVQRDRQVGRRQALRPQLPQEAKSMRAAVKRSPTTCSFRPPVQGDSELPNHDVKVDGQDPQEDAEVDARRRLPRAHASAPAAAGSATRCGCSRSKKRFELRRGPAGGGFPVQGQEQRDQEDQRAQPASPHRRRRGDRGRSSTARRSPRSTTATPARSGPQDPLRDRQPEGQEQGSVVATFKRVAVAVPTPRPATPGPRSRPRRSSDRRRAAPARAGRQLAGDRPQRRSQHLRPRRPHARPA